MRVHVLIIGKHDEAVSHLMHGMLTRNELELLATKMIETGPHARQRIVSADPNSELALILQQIYKYEKDGDIYYEDHDTPGTGDFVQVSSNDCWKDPFHVIVWSLWD